MYDNIGKKIKVLAKAVFIVEAICAIIGGIITLITVKDEIKMCILMQNECCDLINCLINVIFNGVFC